MYNVENVETNIVIIGGILLVLAVGWIIYYTDTQKLKNGIKKIFTKKKNNKVNLVWKYYKS